MAVLPFAIAAAGQPISARGLAWLLCAAVAIVGLAIGARWARIVAGLAGIAWLGVIATTLVWPARTGVSFLEPMVLPERAPPSVLGRVFAERDVSLVGVRLMRALRGVSARELEGFEAPLAALYGEIEARDGVVTSTPFLATMLGEQDAWRFDAFVHVTPGARERWVVFLHGYGGSFASYCWIVARAAEDAGWSTICPATSFDGRWDRGHGPAIVHRTLDWIDGQGARDVVLVGLSNGGVGASRLARELGGVLTGLVLISGLDSRAEPVARPTLVWHGTADERFPISQARTYASRAEHAQLVEVEGGDHFAMVEQRDQLARDLTAFLAALAR